MPKKELGISSVVYENQGQNMLTGVFSEKNIDSWKWDKRSIESKQIKSTYHDYNIGGFKYNLDEGVSALDWRNQVLSNISFLTVENVKQKDFDIWMPLYSNGTYSMFGKSMNLYSSYSFTGVASEETEGFIHELHENAQIDTIDLSIYQRNSYYCKLPYKSWSYNDTSKKRNYTILDNKIVTSSKDRVSIGLDLTVADKVSVIEESFENKEASSSLGRIIFSNFFPIKEGSLKVFAIKGESLIELKEVENLSFEDDTNYIYDVDYELGIIKSGGIKHVELLLKDSIDQEVTEIQLSSIENLMSYPDSGIIKIQDELIFYNNKSRTAIYNCIRGYSGTTAEAHEKGVSLSHIQNGKTIGEDYNIYIGYDTLPRVQYEISNKSIRKSNKNMFVDLHPFVNLRENGIIQISNVERHVSKLSLEINAKKLGGILYGPGYFGIDYKQLTATAYDSLGNTVEDVEITIKILNNGNGFFNSNTKVFKDISNQEGQIHTFYNAPYNWEDISKDVYRTYHSGDETIMEIEEIPAGSLGPEQIQLYEVLKHDPTFGYNGLGLEVISHGNGYNHVNGTPGSTNAYLELNSAVLSSVDSFEGAKCVIQFDDDGILTRTIEKAIDAKDLASDERRMILILDKQVALFNIPNKQIKKAWVYERKTVDEPNQPNSLEWNTFHKIGALKVVYHWNDNVTHPITRDTGAYYPLRPLMPLQAKELTFDGKLKIPDPFNREEMLGGYIVVCSSTVEFQAFCKDPLTNRTIVSNIVALRLDLPKYLNGVSFDEALPVPYGFGIVSDELEVGTGLGGANFISINPLAENINTLKINLKES